MGKRSATLCLFLALFALAGADILFVEGLPFAPPPDTPEIETPPPPERRVPVPPAPTGTTKAHDPDVLSVLQANDFTTSEESVPSILTRVIPEENAENIHVFVLLKKNDRAGMLAWVESPAVKTYYLILKEALHASFSPEVRDLVDETQKREGHPVRNLLTFKDPGISEERIAFVRVRQRLYEFHITEDAEDMIFALIEELTK